LFCKDFLLNPLWGEAELGWIGAFELPQIGRFWPLPSHGESQRDDVRFGRAAVVAALPAAQ